MTLYARQGWDCQLGREARVHDIGLSEHDAELMKEVQRLHREREYLTHTLVAATGQTIAEVRIAMRIAMGQDPSGVGGHDTAKRKVTT